MEMARATKLLLVRPCVVTPGGELIVAREAQINRRGHTGDAGHIYPRQLKTIVQEDPR